MAYSNHVVRNEFAQASAIRTCATIKPNMRSEILVKKIRTLQWTYRVAEKKPRKSTLKRETTTIEVQRSERLAASILRKLSPG